ncbi:MAG: hypothetical protein IK089_06490 [Oxalobacter sp.]|nr:hypothetical protein [Oxalobacter sp.]
MARRKEITIQSSAAQYRSFLTADGASPESQEIRFEDENHWFPQNMMAS